MTLVERLGAASVEERRTAIAELAARDAATPEELVALAACLGYARKAVQRPAAEVFAALASRGVAVGPVLQAALAAPDPRLRWGAAYALSLVGPPPAAVLPVLVDALGSGDGDVRWAAARILPRVAARDATIALLRDLASTGTAPQRKMALYGLRDLDARGSEIDATVVAALTDPDRGVRLAAVTTLSRVAMNRARAAEQLIAIVNGDDPPVARSAAAALGVLRESTPAVLTALRTAAAGGDPPLAQAANRALTMLTARPAS